MLIPDINLLVYAHNEQAPHHASAKRWWENTLNGDERVGLPWVVTAGFIRLVTHPRVLTKPLPAAEAVKIVRSWLDQPLVSLLSPGDRHPALFLNYLTSLGTAGNLTRDAQIAAIAVEYQATLCSNDHDFARFDGLRWHNPLKPPRSKASPA